MSDYLATFILIAVAVAGSALVYGAASSLASSAGGPSVAVYDGTVRQGAYFATESLAVSNLGRSSFSNFTITTLPGPAGGAYCYSLVDPKSLDPEGTTCPEMVPGPGTVEVPYPLPPGGSVLVDIYVTGGTFTVGAGLQATVTTSTGAEGTTGLQVVPA